MREQTLLSLLADAAEECPERTALIDGSTFVRTTYGQLYLRVDRLAGALWRAGLRPGDNVVAFSERSIELVEILLATARIKCVCMPFVGPDHKAEEINHARKMLGPALYLFDSAGASYRSNCRPGEIWMDVRDLYEIGEALGDIPWPTADDTFYCNHSSGSTGSSKLVMATHRQIIANAHACAEIYRYGPDDIYMCTFRLHAHDLFARPFVARMPAVVLSRAEDPFTLVGALQNASVTCMMSDPHTLSGLNGFIEGKLRGLRLRLVECGGGYIHRAIKQSLAKKIGTPVVSVWGSTETTGVAIAPTFGAARGHRLGMALPGYQLTLIRPDGTLAADGEEGELVIKGVAVAQTYFRELNALEETSRLQNGIFRTGDLARRHLDGSIELRGRIANNFKVGATFVNADRIETAIREVCPVSDVVVIPFPSLVGTLPVALVVADSIPFRYSEALLVGQLEDPLLEMPVAFIPIQKVPRTVAGKVDRIAAQALFPIAGVGRGRRQRLKPGKAFMRLWQTRHNRTWILGILKRNPRSIFLILRRVFAGLTLW